MADERHHREHSEGPQPEELDERPAKEELRRLLELASHHPRTAPPPIGTGDDEATTAAALLGGTADVMDRTGTMIEDWHVLVAPDALEGHAAVELVRASLDEPGDVLIDLRSCTLLTADGARALLDIHRLAQMEGKIAALVGPVRLVERVLSITGVDTVVPILPGTLGGGPLRDGHD